MKLGANTYAFLWSDTLEDSVKILGDHGYRGIEFLVSPPHFNLSEYRPGMYAKLRGIMESYGMETLCVNIPSLDINIASPFPEMRKMTLGLYRRLTDICLELGGKIMLVVPGKRHPLLPQPYDRCLDWARDSVEQVLAYTADTGLTVGLETVPAKFLDSVEQLKAFRDSIGSERLKIVFDVTNVYMTEDHPEEKLALVKDDVCLMHLSDTTRKRWEHAPLGTGDVDCQAFLKYAEKMGYDGYLVLEIINNQGVVGLDESVARLRQLGWKPDNHQP